MSEEKVLIALSDLANGALNHYKTVETTLIKQRVIEDYINQLQRENQKLKEQLKLEIKVRDDNHQYLHNKLDLYKSVIDEVRECLESLNPHIKNMMGSEVFDILNKANIKESE